jgi:hypothetical protein
MITSATQPMLAAIRTLIADDHVTVREGLAAMIDRQPDVNARLRHSLRRYGRKRRPIARIHEAFTGEGRRVFYLRRSTLL